MTVDQLIRRLQALVVLHPDFATRTVVVPGEYPGTYVPAWVAAGHTLGKMDGEPGVYTESDSDDRADFMVIE
jgi:hypothetical protein